jgi:hypothetical protein
LVTLKRIDAKRGTVIRQVVRTIADASEQAVFDAVPSIAGELFGGEPLDGASLFKDQPALAAYVPSEASVVATNVPVRQGISLTAASGKSYEVSVRAGTLLYRCEQLVADGYACGVPAKPGRLEIQVSGEGARQVAIGSGVTNVRLDYVSRAPLYVSSVVMTAGAIVGIVGLAFSIASSQQNAGVIFAASGGAVAGVGLVGVIVSALLTGDRTTVTAP